VPAPSLAPAVHLCSAPGLADPPSASRAAPATTSDPGRPSEIGRPRLQSLDALRGLTVAAMILVNNMGDRRFIHPPLAHASWHGCTPTDLIFPFFLFMVGCSIPLALARRGQRPAPSAQAGTGALLPIARRAGLLVLIGLVLQAVPFTFDEPLRVVGILQRIGVCFFFAATLAAFTRPATQALVGAGLLVAHTAALLLVPVPGFGAGDLAKGHELSSWLDRLVLGKPDPEGLLSTVPAVATTIAGLLAGRWILTARPLSERVCGLFLAGLAGVLLGLAAEALVPLNKRLWTASYVLYAGGWACQALAACAWLIDGLGLRGWAAPLLPFGRNPIVAFVASTAVARVLVHGITWPAPEGEPRMHAKRWLHEALFAPGGPSANTSLAYAAAFLFVWWLVVLWLDRKKIYIRV
jgi:predicted acyltransferase